jgi:hypothetical protein
MGAFRWDAWQATGSVPNAAVTRALTPPYYHHRLPFFARITDAGVAIEGGTMEVMEAEIALARRAGLSFWAFLAYRRESAMSDGLRLYLAARERKGLRFCLAAELASWGSASTRSTLLDWHVELLGHPDHQRTRDGRPIYMLGFLSERMITERWGGVDGLRAAVDRFRARAANAGARDPYLVLIGRPRTAARFAGRLGADAVGAYDLAGEDIAAPYASLARHAETAWDEFAAAGLPLVPTAMAGWDRRPRIENPMPWETWQRPGVGMERHYGMPTPEQLARHVGRAVDRAALERTNVALIYAWNEHDEGGWLVPTLPHDDSRIAALRRVLCAPTRHPRVEGCAAT